MKLRKVVSLTSALAFVVLVFTSVILFIVPYGRVAYWADWRFIGLTKTQWGDIHINIGAVFLIFIVLHIYLNWKPLLAYLKDRAKRWRVLTPDFNLAIILVVVTVAGTLAQAPPFGSLLQLNQAIKEAASQKYGEPPYGHAELSTLKAFSAKVGIAAETALARLASAGIKVAGDSQSLQEIARENGLSPRQVYRAMSGFQTGGQESRLPELPPAGMGRMTINQVCRQFSLDAEIVLHRLEASGIKVAGDRPIRELAAELGMTPPDLYGRLRQAAGRR